ncbi:DUF4377 domain-containing protein [Sphingobacterium sp.]|uniref:DUF4377 domain-containing protein n=1 Tax=Sphingobacterium sp. TaxID=341027 RepID=UPI0031D7915D
MNKSLKYILFFIPLFLIQYTTQAQSSVFRIKVKSGLDNTPPYLVKYYNSKDWEKFYAEILQFNYNPGFEYNIRVKKTTTAQASIYTLQQIINKSPAENTEIAIWDVAEYYVNNPMSGKLACLQIKSNKKNKWEYIAGPILGFDYQEQYRYRIKVKQTKVKDTDSLRYELMDIISKERVTELPSVASFLARFKWNLLQLNGKDVTSSKAYIGFDAKNGTIAGSTGCNNFWGNFNIKGNLISFPHLASNMKSCNGPNNIENDFFAIIEQKQIQFDIAEQTLNLYIDGKLVMIFGLERE